MNTVAQLLANKKHWNEGDFGTNRIERVHTVSQGTTILEAAHLMNEHHVGSLVVVGTFGEMDGIISERDILTRVVTTERNPSTTLVREVMTQDVVSCEPSSTLGEVRRIMKDQHIRHLPVVDDGTLMGMISIGDLNAASNADLSIEVKAMREYISSG
jgi:CBS domain-containing protein